MKPVRLSLALLTMAALATSAEANFFHNRDTNVSRNVGSAPSPTPEEVRAARGEVGVAQIGNIMELIGRTVYGGRGENLGLITDVDPSRNLVAVRLPDESAVALPINALYDDGRRVFAPAMGREQMLAMARIPPSEFDQ